MIKGKAAYFVLGVVVLAAVLLRLFSINSKWVCVNGSWERQGNPMSAKPAESCSTDKQPDEQTFILEGEPATTTAIMEVATSTATTSIQEVPKMALLTEPQASSTVSSPLIVKGEAPGYWFFEASLPIKILDSQGNVIASAPASAQSDPLTDNLVPFKSLLEFNTTATSGYVVINNDNPSGLPENELSVKIPVLFLKNNFK